ncbi:MAG: Protein DegV [Eubacteriales bacterium SKADARSKE-1]|nr:Protein DegV [Eubacteriales bacterium SKADARSKE-1]
MQDYIIFTDSTADLPQDIVKKLDVKIIPMELTFDGEKYFKDVDMDFKAFYKDLKNGKLPKTTCTNSATFFEHFEPYLNKNKDILYICFSSANSRTYECAIIAANELNEKYTNKVTVIDSLSASLGQGLLAYHAAKKRRNGLTLEEVRDWLDENKTKVCHLFTVDDLFHLKRGGRISAASASFGTVLNVKPILNINDEGFLTPKGKVRGRKTSLQALINEMEKGWVKSENEVIFISHADALDDANFIADQIREKFGVENIVISYIGPTIGSHTGVGTIALFFFGSKR